MEIFTHGGLDIYVQLFNAIATVTGDSNYITLLRLILLLGLVFILFETVVKMDIHRSLRWLGLIFLFYSIALVPKVTLNIEDTLYKQAAAVDNVPLGLALPASLLSNIAYRLTIAIEDVFHLPDDLNYSSTGMVMGSQLLIVASQFGITDIDFNQDVENFTRQCIFYDLLLGKYTWGELANSTDIWAFVAANTSPARTFKVKGDYQTCIEGVVTLEKGWENAIDHAASIYGTRFFGQWQKPEQAKAQLLKTLPITYEYFTGMAVTATNVMQQNMMANLIRKTVGSNASINNASAAAQEFAVQRSDAQMRASLQISGSKAAYWLSITRIVLEGVLFGAFILLFPLFLLPKGGNLLKHYLLVLLTLELIPPMYAITHLIISTAAASYGAASIHDPGGDGLNLATQLGLALIHQDIAAVAGRVSLALPFITYALVAGSGYAFMQFANSVIAGPAESAAGVAASELTAGNYNFGNTTLDTSSIANSSRYHHDHNISRHDGLYSYTDSSGGTVTHTPDGREIFHAGGGISSLGSQLGLSQAVENHYSQAYEQSLSTSNSQSQAYAESMTHALRENLDLQQSRGQSTIADDSHSRSDNSQFEQSINTVAQLTQDFAKAHNLNDNQATQIMGEASVSASVGTGNYIPVFSAQASVSAKASAMTETQYQETLSAAEKVTNSEEYRQAISTIQSFTHNERVSDTDEQSLRLSDGINSALDNAQTARDEMMNSLQAAETAKQAMNQVQSNRAHYDVTWSQAFYDWLPQQAGIDVNTARHIITNEPDTLGAYMQQFITEKADTLLPANVPGEEAIRASYAAHTLNKADTIQQAYADSNHTIIAEADRAGLDHDSKVGGNLREEIITMQTPVNEQVQRGAASLTDRTERLKETVTEGATQEAMQQRHAVGAKVIKLMDKVTGKKSD